MDKHIVKPKHLKQMEQDIIFENFERDFKVNEHDYCRNPIEELKRFLEKYDYYIDRGVDSISKEKEGK